MECSWNDLVAGTLRRDPRRLAQLISRVEDREAGWQEAMKALFPHAGAACLIGITGPPGAGKSSLTSCITSSLVARGRRVGIIAVDPTSPFSGGALLGDRLRMHAVATTPGVFIRSMATRGTLGGLCQGARDVARILAAAGHDIILLETVGVGQDEIEVVKAADLVVVVCVPGQGDGVQTLKAGIMEIADLFVVNKADRDGADVLVADIRAMQALTADDRRRTAPVLETCALTGQGVEALVGALLGPATGSQRGGTRDEARVREEILTLLEREVARLVRQRWDGNGTLDDAVQRVCSGETDPYSAAQTILRAVDLVP
ncbi:MAG TPA: methylmalonyl Co-A mutase-associated GTPase MeaB [Candidatus Margulisiibacteriota bacterium]|nr:methylmalonyl Co-A mutase-associated GTPase MeaB [Candidatus Margulisiibacteriota bacterium]